MYRLVITVDIWYIQYIYENIDFEYIEGSISNLKYQVYDGPPLDIVLKFFVILMIDTWLKW